MARASVRSWTEHLRGLGADLERHFEALDAWYGRLEQPAAAHDESPATDGWSAREVLEHVVLANRYLLLLIEKMARRCQRKLQAGGEPPAQVPAPSDVDRIAHREFSWSHPEHMTPRGDADMASLRAELGEQRRRVRALLENMPAGEGALHTVRMSLLGTRLDLYGFLAVVDRHAVRHLAQLERLASP